MHYTGMAAASFIPAPPPDLSYAVSVSPIGNSGVVTVTLIVIVAAIVTSSVDRRAAAEVTAALEEAQGKLAHVTRTQAMGELAAAIAHDGEGKIGPLFQRALERRQQQHAALGLEQVLGDEQQARPRVVLRPQERADRPHARADGRRRPGRASSEQW